MDLISNNKALYAEVPDFFLKIVFDKEPLTSLFVKFSTKMPKNRPSNRWTLPIIAYTALVKYTETITLYKFLTVDSRFT